MDTQSYTSKIVGYMNGAAACFAISVAKETGLLSLFINPHQPMTITEIATKAKLKQRYVQELLGCLVAARVIDIDDTSELYHLPDELRSTLNSLTVTTDMMAFTNDRKEDLKSILDLKGPNGYSGMCKDGYGKLLSSRRLVDVNGLISDEFFNETPELKQQLEDGIDFVEYGCAEGPVIMELASRFPNSRFMATDYSPLAMEKVRENIKLKQLTNITAQQADLYDLPSDWTGKFDVAYVRDVLHDLGDPVKGTSEIVRSVKKGGIVNIIEIAIKGNNHKENREDPMAPALFAFSSTICLPESLCQPGSLGLGCTSGLQRVKDVLGKGGIPEAQMEIFPSKISYLHIRILYRKN